jgi:transmembrane sensor
VERDISHIIVRHLNGTSSAGDEIEIQQWLEENPENQQIFQDYIDIWKATGDIQLHHFDAQKGWERFKANLEKEEGPKIVSIHRNTASFPLLKIAATLAIIISIGALVYYFNFSSKIQHQYEYATTGNEIKEEITLVDGTKIWLNKNSRLTLALDFGKNERRVTLEGEGFFEVSKDAQKPFIIETARSLTTILGTSFNIRAYAEDEEERITMVTGIVDFFSKQQKSSLKIKAGEEALISQAGDLIKTEPETVNFLAWKNQRLVFKDASLALVLDDLENYFGFDIVIENPEIMNCRFTGTFDNPQQSDVLNTISTVLEVEIEQNGQEIIISGKGC